MISLSLSFGISDLGIKNMVLVPFIMRMPCAIITSSFASEVLQMSQCPGRLLGQGIKEAHGDTASPREG